MKCPKNNNHDVDIGDKDPADNPDARIELTEDGRFIYIKCPLCSSSHRCKI